MVIRDDLRIFYSWLNGNNYSCDREKRIQLRGHTDVLTSFGKASVSKSSSVGRAKSYGEKAQSLLSWFFPFTCVLSFFRDFSPCRFSELVSIFFGGFSFRKFGWKIVGSTDDDGRCRFENRKIFFNVGVTFDPEKIVPHEAFMTDKRGWFHGNVAQECNVRGILRA